MPAIPTTPKIIDIRQKCLYTKYPTITDLWEEAKNYLHYPSTTPQKTNARWFVGAVHNRIKYRVYMGSEGAYFSRLMSKLSTDWGTIQKRETLFSKLFEKIETVNDKILTLKTIETSDEGGSKDSITSRNNTRLTGTKTDTMSEAQVIDREIPISTIDLLAGEFGELFKGDMLQVEHKEKQGRREKVEGEFWTDANGKQHQKYKEKPNTVKSEGNIIDKGNDKGKEVDKRKVHREIKRDEQPNYALQVAKIIQSFQQVETYFTDIIESYDRLGFYGVFMPMGEIGWDYTIRDIGYIPHERKLAEAEKTEQKKEKAEGKDKENLQQISKEVYEQLKRDGKSVEKSWVLENLIRRKESIEGQSEKQNPNIKTLRDGLDGMIEAYWENVVWTDLANFDKVMNSITGFKEFKRELRNRTELIERYKRRGKKMKQIFYCLQGKAGVGKSEISQRLAKAYKRPINILGMAGANHPKILKGMRPTLNMASFGEVAKSFIEKKYTLFKTSLELETELKLLKKKKTEQLTRLEVARITFLEEEIKDIALRKGQRKKIEKQIADLKAKATLTMDEDIDLWEKTQELKTIDGKYYDLSSQAPVILIDEFEKAKDETVLFIVGQMTDKALNWAYYDDFLETYIDLSQAIILLTSNYWHKVPDFVRSRCKRVNINLLSYAERLEILHTILGVQIRERFYAETDREDAWRSANGTWTNQQLQVINAFGAEVETTGKRKGFLKGADKFLRLMMTEEFGVRGSIQNLEYALDFCELMIGRKTDPNQSDENFKKDEFGNSWLGEIKDLNNYEKVDEENNIDGSGIFNITYNLGRKHYPTADDYEEIKEILTFDKKRDIEVIESQTLKQGKKEAVLNMVSDWQDWQGNIVYEKTWTPPNPADA